LGRLGGNNVGDGGVKSGGMYFRSAIIIVF
jgi:hypothetical protein